MQDQIISSTIKAIEDVYTHQSNTSSIIKPSVNSKLIAQNTLETSIYKILNSEGGDQISQITDLFRKTFICINPEGFKAIRANILEIATEVKENNLSSDKLVSEIEKFFNSVPLPVTKEELEAKLGYKLNIV